MERTKMPNLRNGSKGEFEPGLTWLPVRHSTAELLPSTVRPFTWLIALHLYVAYDYRVLYVFLPGSLLSTCTWPMTIEFCMSFYLAHCSPPVRGL